MQAINQIDKNRSRLEKVQQIKREKLERQLEELSDKELVSELKDKGLPVFGTRRERQERLRKAYGLNSNQPSKKKSTRDEIDAISKRRDERRRRMEAERTIKEEKKAENEALGKQGDVDFHLMIENYKQTLPEQMSYVTSADLKINVLVRKRPIFQKEELSGEIDSTMCINPKVIVFEPKFRVDGITKYLEDNHFQFDNAFGEQSTNDEVYNYSLKPLAPFILKRGTATCFAYGQTGSGKTYTMKGLQKMIVDDIFQLSGNRAITLFVSFFEIYGGRCLDLLNKRQKLRILEDRNQNIQIQGLQESPASNAEEVHRLIEIGNSARTTHATSSNEDSSRSHAVCQLILKQNNEFIGKLNLVDLAGSERAQDCMSNERNRRLEGAEINKSLLSLKECIRAYSTGESRVPYRGSKLTLVLREAFTSKNSKILMITCISPGHSSADHTLNSLRYAERLKDKSSEPIARQPLTENQQSAHSSIQLEDEQPEFDQFHQKVEDLLEKEEELLQNHVFALKEDAAFLTQEGNMIDMVQQSDEYDIDQYVNQLENIVTNKLSVYQNLYDHIIKFKQCLRAEETVSHQFKKNRSKQILFQYFKVIKVQFFSLVQL